MIVQINISVRQDDDTMIAEKMLKVQTDSTAILVFNWAHMVQEVINALIKQLVGSTQEP